MERCFLGRVRGGHVVMDSVDAFCLEAGPSKQLLKAYSFIVELLWDVGYVADMLLGSPCRSMFRRDQKDLCSLRQHAKSKVAIASPVSDASIVEALMRWKRAQKNNRRYQS